MSFGKRSAAEGQNEESAEGQADQMLTVKRREREGGGIQYDEYCRNHGKPPTGTLITVSLLFSMPTFPFRCSSIWLIPDLSQWQKSLFLGYQMKCNKRIGHPGGRQLCTENDLTEISSTLALEEDEEREGGGGEKTVNPI